MTALSLVLSPRRRHNTGMGVKYRVQIRQYPRAGGVTWRWWVFDQHGGTHLDTGVIVGGDRAAVERAATYAIELLKQQNENGPRSREQRAGAVCGSILF